MRVMRRQESTDDSLLSVRTSTLGSDRKSRDGEGASVVKLLSSGGYHAQDQESGSVKHKKARTSSLDSFHDAKSTEGNESSSSSISSARERRVGKDLRVPKRARARDRDSDRTVTRSDARQTN